MTKENKVHQPPPVAGYVPLDDKVVQVVNKHKIMEETLLRMFDQYKLVSEIDQRWLAIARTHLEESFMALNRSVFKPQRIDLTKVNITPLPEKAVIND